MGYRWSDEEDVAVTGVANVREKWNEAVELFNTGQYYTCHDVLEELWQQAQEPQRSVIHGLLQCAVGMHHLLAQNHQGAMMEFGEGLNKLRRYTSSSATLRYSRPALPEISSSSSLSSSSSAAAAPAGGAGGSSSSMGSMCWVEAFEREATAVLEFIYSTQLEHAACSQEVCVTMDGSDESYARLGNYGRGQQLYRLSLAHAVSNEHQSEQQLQQQQQPPGGAGEGERWQLEFCPPRDFVAAVSGELPPAPPLLAVVVPRLDPSHADLDNLVW